MYINITDKSTANNKGSSGALVSYLEKENNRSPEHLERWFNQSGSEIDPVQVRAAIDNNIAKLEKEDAKFFLINISPSQKEIAHLKSLFGEERVRLALKEYAVQVMDAYAQNFMRAGIRDNRDLLWFGKLENNRYYTFKDQEVKAGLARRGEIKKGDQMHVQIIVSRKDITNKIKLSPMNTSKGKNAAHSQKLGQFDRMAFKQSGEVLFDQTFAFDRGLDQTLAYVNTLKNGSLEQKTQMDLSHRIEQQRLLARNKIAAHARAITNNLVAQHSSKLVEVLLKSTTTQAEEQMPIPRQKKKKGKPIDYSQGLGM